MHTILIYSLISIFGTVWGALRHKNAKIKKIDEAIREWVPIAYDVVNNMIIQNPEEYTGMNKTALFTEELTRIMESKGIKVTPEIIMQALAIADSMHYQDKENKKYAESGIYKIPPGKG